MTVDTSGATPTLQWWVLLGSRIRHKTSQVTMSKRGIREQIKDYSIQEHLEIVVDHLNGKQRDCSGLLHFLQKAVSFLLAKGKSMACQLKRVTYAGGCNGGQWFLFQTQVREVVKSYTISEHLGATDKVMVSTTNPNFVLTDTVFLHPPPPPCYSPHFK